MSNVHSIIPPSSAGIWGKTDGCTGWVYMSQLYPETVESVEAMEGDASHEIGATIINGAKIGHAYTADNFIDKTATNGVIFTLEMYEAARIYADDVIKVMRERAIFDDHFLGVEEKILAKNIHELSFGTSDCFIFDRMTYDLYMWDYKYGFEIHEAYEHWQTINYIAGLVERFNISGLEDQKITVHLRIAQPRAFHRDGDIREWTTKLSNLRGYFNTLQSNAHIALGNNAVTRTGDHCRHCTARHDCKAALDSGMRLYEIAIKPTTNDMSMDAVGVQYAILKRARKQLDYLESGYEQVIKTYIRSGVNVPGWMTESVTGREHWIKPVPEVIQLGELMGLNLKKPDAAITPTQARKLGLPGDVAKEFTETPRTGIKLVPDNLMKARKIFGYTPQEEIQS